MKISYADYIKKSDVSVLVAEAIFSELEHKYPLKKIGEVAETTSGGTPSRGNSDFYNGDIPWLKSGELNDSEITEAEEFITEKGLANSSAKLHPEETLLLAMYGATAGKTGITKFKAATNQAICAIFPNSKVKRDYLFWFFRQHRHKFIEMSKGGAQPNISQSLIKETLLPLPDDKTQESIVSILNQIQQSNSLELSIIPDEFKEKVVKVFFAKNSVSDITTELTHQLDLVKQLRQSFLREAMQGKLVEPTHDGETGQQLLAQIKAEKARLIKAKKLKAGKTTGQSVSIVDEVVIPNRWQWCKADDIFFITKLAGFEYTEHIKFTGDGEIPVVRAQNVRPLKIDKSNLVYIDRETSNYLDRCALTKKCLLVTFIGAGIGDVAMFDEKERWHLAPNVAKVEPFDGCEDLIDVKFVNFFMLSDLGQKEIFKHVKATAQPSLSMGTIRDIDIPLPPLSEQRRIVEKLESLMQTCDALEASIKDSQVQNQQLLQQVLREALRK